MRQQHRGWRGHTIGAAWRSKAGGRVRRERSEVAKACLLEEALQWRIGTREGGWIRVIARGAATKRCARSAPWAAGSGTSGGGVVPSLLEPGECMGVEGKFGRWAGPDSTPGRTVAAGRARLTDFPKHFQYFTTLNL
jgi:hypothetical protein